MTVQTELKKNHPFRPQEDRLRIGFSHWSVSDRSVHALVLIACIPMLVPMRAFVKSLMSLYASLSDWVDV